MVDPTEEQLIEQAKADPMAFATLYDRYVDRIYSYVRRSTHDVATAQDITSSTFEKALMALPRYRSRQAPFVAWLYRIARNELISHWRRERLRVPWRRRGTDGDPVLRHVEEQEAWLAVWQALKRLAPRDRDILVLRFYEALDSAQVAAVLGCKVNAVYVRIHRALRRLEQELATIPREET